MKKYTFIGIVFVVVVLIAAACQKDIVLPELPTLEGTYKGDYRVITGYQTSSPETTYSTIEMLFDDVRYFFNDEDTLDAFCSPRGEYVLSANNIELSENQDNCTVIAKQSDNPRGQFNIQRPADSLIMIQQDTTTNPDTFKHFLLKKI